MSKHFAVLSLDFEAGRSALLPHLRSSFTSAILAMTGVGLSTLDTMIRDFEGFRAHNYSRVLKWARPTGG